MTLFDHKLGRERNPPLKEIQVHIAVAQLLRRTCKRDWIWTHLPFGEKREARDGAKLYRMGTNRGWPDFVFFDRHGRAYFLELKRRGGTLDEHQLSFFAAMRARDVACEVASSIEEAIRILGKWGVVPISVKDAG